MAESWWAKAILAIGWKVTASLLCLIAPRKSKAIIAIELDFIPNQAVHPYMSQKDNFSQIKSLGNGGYLVNGKTLSYDTQHVPLLCFLNLPLSLEKNSVWLDERNKAQFSKTNPWFLQPCGGKTKGQNHGDTLDKQLPRLLPSLWESPQFPKLEYIERVLYDSSLMPDILYMALERSGPYLEMGGYFLTGGNLKVTKFKIELEGFNLVHN